MTKSGIYKITNKVNGKIYIGSSIDIKSRWRKHQSQLRHNKHGNSHLQRAWNKYGEENFTFETLEYVQDKYKLILCEQKWFDKEKPYEATIGYNICPTAGSSLGVKHTDEMKAKVSKAVKGRKLSTEARKNIALAKMGEKNPMYGYAYSKEQRKQMSVRTTGERNPFYGTKHTKETREKMSKNSKGKNSGPKTKEHIDKITKSATETKRKNSALNKEIVLEMRRLREEEGWRYTKIAKKFSTTVGQVGKICRYERWRF